MVQTSTTPTEEKLFLNTLTFDYPKEGVTMYFSDKDVSGVSLFPLTNLYPDGIENCFSNIQTGTKIYTSFTRPLEGFASIKMDFSNPANFFFVKRYYNREIMRFFRKQNILVAENFVKDTDVYIPSNTVKHDGYLFDVYNRFNIKVNFNEVLHKPELVVSYGRTMLVMQKSMAKFMSDYTADHSWEDDDLQSPIQMVIKTVEKKPMNDTNKWHLRLVNLRRRQENIQECRKYGRPASDINYEQHHLVVNRSLKTYFHMDEPKEDNGLQQVNRYTRFLPLIQSFIKDYLANERFRAIIPFAHNFTQVTAGQLPARAMSLCFGNNTTHRVPQVGLNNGPYQQPSYYNIYLFFIMPSTEVEIARQMIGYFQSGYGEGYSRFAGLQKYLGIPIQVRKGLSITYNPLDSNPLSHIQAEIEKRQEFLSDPSALYMCIYLSPINKRHANAAKREIYYQVKELLLRHNIPSQCVDLSKLNERLSYDRMKGKYTLSYSLQNIAVAINAKLGGQPWIIAVPPQREFVIGVGAFHNADSKEPYIGAAFVFNNTGAFNKYTYFQKQDLSLLMGAIEEEICNYRRTFDNPSRIIIHYYKVMREDEANRIEEMLQRLQLDIPFYVVTINETESEDIFVFDKGNPALLPMSGRYVSLGKNTYLLCNNTRYENSEPKPGDGYPFPVKIRLSCRSIETMPQSDIEHLIEQVYQFSRIYWKSVRQQNLPVTIMYPKMIAEIMPHFLHPGVSHNIAPDRLWFL